MRRYNCFPKHPWPLCSPVSHGGCLRVGFLIIISSVKLYYYYYYCYYYYGPLESVQVRTTQFRCTQCVPLFSAAVCVANALAANSIPKRGTRRARPEPRIRVFSNTIAEQTRSASRARRLGRSPGGPGGEKQRIKRRNRVFQERFELRREKFYSTAWIHITYFKTLSGFVTFVDVFGLEEVVDFIEMT